MAHRSMNLLVLAASILTGCLSQGVGSAAPTPSFANVSYGPHERNVLDFWKADSDKPTPVIVFIHGGGFRKGGKENYASNPILRKALERGISCAAINYRFLPQAPIQDILRDGARAVQFLRFKAAEWNIDKARIAGVGGSAGAGTCLWLTTRDDLADPKAADPVLRESSRLCCAAINGTQATYDVTRWESFLGPAQPSFSNPAEAFLFYHLTSLNDLASPKGKEVLRDCDMLGWISPDDGPVFMDNPQDVAKPSNRGEWLHCTLHARTVKKAYEAVGNVALVVQDEKEERLDAGQWLAKQLGLN